MSEEMELRQVSISLNRCQSDNAAETNTASQKFGHTSTFPFDCYFNLDCTAIKFFPPPPVSVISSFRLLSNLCRVIIRPPAEPIRSVTVVIT